MLIKSFFGDSMTEAMQRAAKSFGEDALILNSRETPADLRGHGRFEVVATISPADAPPQLAALGESGEANEKPTLSGFRGPREFRAGTVQLMAGLNGAGKTTAALKLAVAQGIWKGRTTAILHFDVNRLARRDAMDWYCQAAGIQHLTPESVEKPDATCDVDLLVVDTSGMSADAALPSWLQDRVVADGYSGHLVVPAWAGEAYFKAASPLVAKLRIEYVLPTFLDDSLLSEEAAAAAARLDLGVRYLSSGAKVPGGFWDSSDAQLATAAEHLAGGREVGKPIAVSPGDRKQPAHPLARRGQFASEMVA